MILGDISENFLKNAINLALDNMEKINDLKSFIKNFEHLASITKQNPNLKASVGNAIIRAAQIYLSNNEFKATLVLKNQFELQLVASLREHNGNAGIIKPLIETLNERIESRTLKQFKIRVIGHFQGLINIEKLIPMEEAEPGSIDSPKEQKTEALTCSQEEPGAQIQPTEQKENPIALEIVKEILAAPNKIVIRLKIEAYSNQFANDPSLAEPLKKAHSYILSKLKPKGPVLGPGSPVSSQPAPGAPKPAPNVSPKGQSNFSPIGFIRSLTGPGT